MHPTGTGPDPRQIVVTLIAVSFQISAIDFQELFCVAATPGRRIAIQDNLWKTSLITSEQPYEQLGLNLSFSFNT